MRKIILFALLLILSATSFSQQTDPSTPLTRADYLQKSKNKKTTAWVLLGGGAALIGTGFLIGGRNESSFDDAATGGIIAVIGVSAALGSIPFFISAGKNKRKGLSMSFKNETAPQLLKFALVRKFVPSLSLKIQL